MAAVETEEIRDQRGAILVPSRYGSGQPVPPDVRGNQISIIAGKLAALFGGASARGCSEQCEADCGDLSAWHSTAATGLWMKRYTAFGPPVSAKALGDSERKEAVMKEA